MRTISLKLLPLALAVLLVGGCVATTPRYGESHHNSSRHGDNRYDSRYDDSSQRYARGYEYDNRYTGRCQGCGTIERIETLGVRNSSIGGGTVLGAVIGGVVGNQVGSGSGRQAATVAGVIAGGVIGHQAEQHRRGDRQVYQFEVSLDDGRWARVTQREHLGLRIGDRVVIRNQQLSQLR